MKDANAYKIVGIVGMPPLSIIRELNEKKVLIHDLDEPIVQRDIENASPFLPRVYCAVLRTVVVNALSLNLDAIYIDVGPGKCDSALYVADILADALPIPIIRTRNQDSQSFGTPISESCRPLVEKLTRITTSVRQWPPTQDIPPPCRPTAGFWGVPPRDFSILTIFPDTTHVYGWSRCMENKTPADLELEKMYNPAVPTVFFSQSFCAKTALARYLAHTHPNGLYLDIDTHTSGSAKAKIEAFLTLTGAA